MKSSVLVRYQKRGCSCTKWAAYHYQCAAGAPAAAPLGQARRCMTQTRKHRGRDGVFQQTCHTRLLQSKRHYRLNKEGTSNFLQAAANMVRPWHTCVKTCQSAEQGHMTNTYKAVTAMQGFKALLQGKILPMSARPAKMAVW